MPSVIIYYVYKKVHYFAVLCFGKIDPELKGTDPKVRTAKRPILNTHATSVHVGGDCSGWLDVGWSMVYDL